ncbi:phage head morphogenesis protein [Pseudoalteromonas sp. T1lg10]|uniref:phage head morphogenesis protein n=1 Tax=Pseudoalteromonas sp. T1lg10 TaxID=2077093 RepID=UPI000CF61756|nr:phage minor head protein [Pseudoalteromonas sp. T1lg10]
MPISAPQYGDLTPFKEAIAFFRQKIKVPTAEYRDIRGLIHSKAFTVAGVTNMEMLTEFYKAVDKAIADGETITAFRKRFDKIVADHGWSYNGKRGWRSEVIYQNNKNTARAAGRWQQQERLKGRRPYLLYTTAGDSRVRPDHNRWSYILLPLDHPFWDTHYPPNGYGCRCKVVSLNKRDIERMGLKVTDPSTLSEQLKTFDTTDAVTGEVLQKYPGIDLGWDYNPGKAWLGADISAGKAIAKLDGELQKIAIPQFNEAVAKANGFLSKQVAAIAAQSATQTSSAANKAFTLGHMSADALGKLRIKNKAAETSTVVITSQVIVELLLNAVATGKQIQLLLGDVIVVLERGSQFNSVVAIRNL